jgi:fructose-bisphosphate aldolase, class II
MVNMFSKKKKLIDVFKEARKEKIAIGQFNFSTLEQLKGISMAAKELGVPVICGTSPGEAKYFGFEEAVSLIRTIKKKENVSIYLNYDHGKDINTLKKAIDIGYDMVHFDGSDVSLEENIKIAKELVLYAKKRGILVEGEVSKILGKSTISNEEIRDVTLTPIEKVVKFVKESGVSCIALDVGSFHGVHKNSPTIHSERVTELIKNVSSFVVLHGGSGIDDETIKELIGEGVTKININTEIRFEWRSSLYNTLHNNPNEIVPYKILPFAVEAVCKKVKEKINLFNYEKNSF